MFVDKVSVELKAGDGGDGMVSFRHEKFVDRGGPDGGDGGKGGDIIAVASNNQNTLAKFRFQKEVAADNGKAGSKRRKAGRSGKDLEVLLPVGTVVYDDKGNVLADLVKADQKVLIAKGGRGGFGNAHFKSSTRQAPRFAEKGDPGDFIDAIFELKMIADIGLVGVPNAGKSTLISVLSNAKPEIANYPFTTLIPNLGVSDIYGRSLLLADIPGLIEGASQGKGLGDEFLRHIERTKVLVHLVDVTNDDFENEYKVIRQELADYKIDLSTKPFVVGLNKIDTIAQQDVKEKLKILKKLVGKKAPVLAISAQVGLGLDELKKEIFDQVKIFEEQQKQTKEEQAEPEGSVRITLDESDRPWTVSVVDGKLIVTGKKIEGFARRTDYDNEEAVGRLKDIMRKTGIMHELERKGLESGDAVYFGEKKSYKIKF